jgi:hypothetical protein
MDGLLGPRVAEPRLTANGLPSVWPHSDQMLHRDALGALPVLECFLLVQAAPLPVAFGSCLWTTPRWPCAFPMASQSLCYSRLVRFLGTMPGLVSRRWGWGWWSLAVRWSA